MPLPEKLVTEIKHMIVSHHGEYEYGSSKLPMTLEAVALHHLDNLDAKIASFTQLMKDCPNVDSPWTQYFTQIGRKLYKGESWQLDGMIGIDLQRQPRQASRLLILMPDRRDDILGSRQHPDYRPVKPKVIAKKIGAEGEAAEAVRKTIKRLVKEGLLAFGPNHLVYPIKTPPAPSPSAGRDGEGAKRVQVRGHGHPSPSPSPSREGSGEIKRKRDPEHVVGTFRRAEAGFGFVRPEGTLSGREGATPTSSSPPSTPATPPTATR